MSTSPKQRRSFPNCSTAHWPARKSSSRGPASHSPDWFRYTAEAAKAGLLRDWKIPSDVFLEPMEPEDLDAAEGKFGDEFGISLPHPDKS